MPYVHEDPKIQAFFEKMNQGICPICDAPMTQQVFGSRIHAMPCGHLLWFFQRYKTVELKEPKEGQP